MTIEIVPLGLADEIVESDDLAALVLGASPPLRDGDIVVVTHKAVSKNEGRVVDLGGVQPSARAVGHAVRCPSPSLRRIAQQ